MQIFKIYCLPRELCTVAVGKKHTRSHRMLAGLAIMAVGVGIAKSASYFETHEIHFVLDMVGYCVHGLGCTPFIEYFVAAEVV